jgi:hypothetical protein
MSLALIDARQWQKCFDLETGNKMEDDRAVADMVSSVLNRHPYPGDTDIKGNCWVSETALDLIEQYEPNLVCLSYAQQFFANRFFDHSKETQDNLSTSVMEEVNSFVERSGYTPVIVGTGDLLPLKGEINLSGLDGLAISSNWSARYCGLHSPSKKDLELLKTFKEVERIVTKKEWVELFQSVQPDLEINQPEELMPDALIVSKPGYAFKTMGNTLRKPVNISGNNFEIPVYSPLGKVHDLRDIRNLIRSNIDSHRESHLDSHKVALIIVEGVGKSFFPDDSSLCSNGEGWFYNEPGDSFYLTLSTGKHQPFAYPAGYKYFEQDEENIKFPFSGYMTSIPENTLAEDYAGKSIAVGNRSMLMHMAFGVDISIECFARNLFNQGCMAVLQDHIWLF